MTSFDRQRCISLNVITVCIIRIVRLAAEDASKSSGHLRRSDSTLGRNCSMTRCYNNLQIGVVRDWQSTTMTASVFPTDTPLQERRVCLSRGLISFKTLSLISCGFSCVATSRVPPSARLYVRRKISFLLYRARFS